MSYCYALVLLSKMLIARHPVGVRPIGEAFLAPGGQGGAQRRRVEGLGPGLAGLDDVLLQDVVESLCARDVLELAAVSHWGYAWSNSPSLWKRLTLLAAAEPPHGGRLMHPPGGSGDGDGDGDDGGGSDGAATDEPSGADGWKLCYRLLRAKGRAALRRQLTTAYDDVRNRNGSNGSSSSSSSGGGGGGGGELGGLLGWRRTRRAVQARGVFSDLLFHSHLCSSAAAFPAKWLRRDNAPRRRCAPARSAPPAPASAVGEGATEAATTTSSTTTTTNASTQISRTSGRPATTPITATQSS